MTDTTPEGPMPEIEIGPDDADAVIDRWQQGYEHAARRAASYFEHTGRQLLADEVRNVMEEIWNGMPDDAFLSDLEADAQEPVEVCGHAVPALAAHLTCIRPPHPDERHRDGGITWEPAPANPS